MLKKITIPMPRRPAVFEEDEVGFQVALGEPTGGAELSNQSAMVVLRNDVGKFIDFCYISRGSFLIISF